ncbi:unnamed protein product [Timema podura]|uniref:Uncharacterized protein n=1 Tax=Timema podura TaxID=61482 RepID=A0ABN7NWC0_TIMPD|nr:unnamed protein product [Timema podura]
MYTVSSASCRKAGSYLLNLNNRYVEYINAFQIFGEATQFVDATSQNPAILINFQYPELTIYYVQNKSSIDL